MTEKALSKSSHKNLDIIYIELLAQCKTILNLLLTCSQQLFSQRLEIEIWDSWLSDIY